MVPPGLPRPDGPITTVARATGAPATRARATGAKTSAGENLVKRLLLLRHAKSAWDQPDLPDAERPLSKRGHRSAPLIGRFMKKAGFLPDLVLRSTAERVAQTWQHIAATWPHHLSPIALPALYMATPREILATLRAHGGNSDSVLVIGHNPGLGDLATWLTAEGDADAITRMRGKFPTASLAVIDLPIENWQDLADTTVDAWGGRLVRFVTPRDLDPTD